MALSLPSLTAKISLAFQAGGAVPTSPFTLAMSAALANAIISEFTDNADVIPAGLPTPLTAPSGGGPVTGLGKVK
jgi:hypothetical protein